MASLRPYIADHKWGLVTDCVNLCPGVTAVGKTLKHVTRWSVASSPLTENIFSSKTFFFGSFRLTVMETNSLNFNSYFQNLPWMPDRKQG